MVELPKNLYDCLEHPKTCAPDDFWGQVRRTVNGKAIPQEQLDLMFATIRQALCLQKTDILLDIACGNGRLGSEFFDQIQGYLGVDLSPCLIEIGKKHFERQATHIFLLQNIREYCKIEMTPLRFTKALCYGSVAYLPKDELLECLSLFRKRFLNITHLFIGAIPDKDLAAVFFQEKEMPDLADHTTAIGRWYTRSEIVALAQHCGWLATINEFPKQFYQSHYRFSATLTPTN